MYNNYKYNILQSLGLSVSSKYLQILEVSGSELDLWPQRDKIQLQIWIPAQVFSLVPSFLLPLYPHQKFHLCVYAEISSEVVKKGEGSASDLSLNKISFNS